MSQESINNQEDKKQKSSDILTSEGAQESLLLADTDGEQDTNKEDVLFHNLYKASSGLPEELGEVFQDINHRPDEIYSQSAHTMEELDPNFILTADTKLLDAAYEKSMEELEDRIAKRDKQNVE